MNQLFMDVLYRFLTGPTNFKDPEARFKFPKIFVSADDGYEELHLIVYKVRTRYSLHYLSPLFSQLLTHFRRISINCETI